MEIVIIFPSIVSNLFQFTIHFSGVTKNLNKKNHLSIVDVLKQVFNKTRSMQRVEIYPSSR